jgi:PAS domain S-box-containing protein
MRFEMSTALTLELERAVAVQRLEGLQALIAALGRVETPQEIYAVALEVAIRVLHMRAGAFTVVREDTQIEIVAGLGQPVQVLDAQRVMPISSDHPLAEVARTGAALYFYSGEERNARYPHLTQYFSPLTRSSAFVPMKVGAETIGVLTLSFPEPHAFDEAERAFIDAIAAACAYALERSRLLETERNAKRELQTAKAQLEAMLENTPVGLAFFDRDLRFILANPEIAKLNRLPIEAHLGRTIDEVLPQSARVLRARLRQIFERNEGVYGVEVSGPTEDGVQYVLASWFPVKLEGQTVLVGASVLDITERKRAEERLREVNDAQRRFVGDAAHELRAPLTSIRGNLSLLLRYPEMPVEERINAATEAEREAGRLSRLITDLLAVARGEAQEHFVVEDLALERILDEVWRSVQQLGSTRRLELGRVESLRVDGDPDALKQVVLVLLENAVKYTPEGGRVGLESLAIDGMAVVRVTDTGQGIAPENLERVFERFFRADKARTRNAGVGGSGLGLTIARRIAERHGGSIHLESELGMGTTAVLRLPLAKSVMATR